MPNPLDPVSPGQRIVRSADQTNAFIEAARFTREFAKRQGGDSIGGVQYESATIKVHNGTDAKIEAGGVVGLGLAVLKATDTTVQPQVTIEAEAPSDTDIQFGAYAILAEPLNKNAIATAYVSGIFWAKVNIATVGDNYAKVTAGTTANLDSDPDTGQYNIITDATATGVQWAIVSPIAGSKESVGQYAEQYKKMITNLIPGWGLICAGPMNVGP